MTSVTVTEVQRSEFDQLGFTWLRGAFPVAAAANMEDALWREVTERTGTRRDDPAAWPRGPVYGLKASQDKTLFDPIGSSTLRSAIDGLLGVGNWKMPRDWGQVLFTLPSTDAWTLPHRLWHVDYDYTLAPQPLPSVQAFSFISDVQPRGGATLVVSRSHLVVSRFVAGRSETDNASNVGTRDAFNAQNAWWSDLTRPIGGPERRARFMAEETVVDGIGLRVIELVGAPGDIALVHPLLVHCAAPNATATPRIVRHTRFNRQVG